MDMTLERAGVRVRLTVHHRDERQIDAPIGTVDVPGLHDVSLIIREGDEAQLGEMPVDHHGVLVVTPVVEATAQVEANHLTLPCSA
jgi:hypothetical protein